MVERVRIGESVVMPAVRQDGRVSSRRDVVLLGSTGSIGTQALDVVRANPDRFRVVALTAGRVAARTCSARRSRSSRRRSPSLGEEASSQAAAMECDVVLNGITGAVGLRPTLAALDAGNTLALANKESLIIGGPVVTSRAKPGQIVPVDSEHSALAQCLRGGRADEVRRLVLTASGGPFRGRSRDELHDVTPEQALAHPTWSMGPFVTINSATLVNKGLEVIEAHLLFGIPFDRIDVVVHPTSVVHSMVEFYDGSTLAQASPAVDADPDRARAWAGRTGSPTPRPAVDWTRPADAGSSCRSTTRRSPLSRLARRGRVRAAARRRRSTTPPTRCASRRSWTVRCGSPTSSPTVERVLAAPRRTLGADGSHRRRRARGRRLGTRARQDRTTVKGPTRMTALMYTARRAAVRRRRGRLDRAARARAHGPRPRSSG